MNKSKYRNEFRSSELKPNRSEIKEYFEKQLIEIELDWRCGLCEHSTYENTVEEIQAERKNVLEHYYPED